MPVQSPMSQVQGPSGRQRRRLGATGFASGAWRASGLPPTAYRLRPSRRGITLLEILVSVFILVVGLLGVAALIPIGNAEVLRAGITHRGAEVGSRGYKEFRARLMGNPSTWLAGGGGAVVEKSNGQMRIADQYRGKAVCIDPLAVAAAQESGQGAANVFPYGSTGGGMSILTLKSQPRIEEAAAPMTLSQARGTFISRDTLFFERPTDRTKPAQQFREAQDHTSQGVRRLGNELYSWMVTLVPQPTDPNLYLLSTVVFYNNVPDTKKKDYTTPRSELILRAQPLGPADFRISASNDVEAANMKKWLRPDRWILMFDAAGGVKGPLFRWYRVVAIEGRKSDDLNSRAVTLDGPEWEMTRAQPQVAIYGGGGVVSVYERMIELDGENMWLRGTQGEGENRQ